MPWCPKCKSEYREKHQQCRECGVELVEELEEEKEKSLGYDSEALLITLNDDLRATMIEARLKDSGIPVLKKYKGAGGYLNIFMGMSNLGVEIYVPSSFLKNAKEIIALELEEE